MPPPVDPTPRSTAATPELSASDDQATIHAIAASSAALRSVGRPESALALLDRVDSIFDRIGPEAISLSPRFLRRERSLALAHLGRLEDAISVADSIRNDTVSDVYQALSWWTIAFIQAIAGRPVTGGRALERADSHLAGRQPIRNRQSVVDGARRADASIDERRCGGRGRLRPFRR